MEEQTGKVAKSEEIDLSVVSRKIRNLFSGIAEGIYNGFLFIKKNIIVLAVLFVIGALGGYLLDKNTKAYEHRIIVSPNFGSVDYLYAKIDLLESKIEDNDTVFLKSIGIQDPKKLLSVKIEPVVDIYNFVNDKSHSVNNAQNTQNFELVKLLAESGDINKILKEETTSKNYSRHTILFNTSGATSESRTVGPILDFLNNTEFYGRMQQLYVANIQEKIVKDTEMIAQIDKVLEQLAKTSNEGQRNEKLVYYNDNNQVNEILNTKNGLIAEMGSLKMDMIVNNKVIRDNSKVLNVRDRTGVNNKLKFLLPLLLVIGFMLFALLRGFVASQSRKRAFAQ